MVIISHKTLYRDNLYNLHPYPHPHPLLLVSSSNRFNMYIRGLLLLGVAVVVTSYKFTQITGGKTTIKVADTTPKVTKSSKETKAAYKIPSKLSLGFMMKTFFVTLVDPTIG